MTVDSAKFEFCDEIMRKRCEGREGKGGREVVRKKRGG